MLCFQTAFSCLHMYLFFLVVFPEGLFELAKALLAIFLYFIMVGNTQCSPAVTHTCCAWLCSFVP